MCLLKILLLVFLFPFIFFTAAPFHLAGRSLLAASISHFLTTAMKLSCFSFNEIRLLCFQFFALALSLSSIQFNSIQFLFTVL